MRNLSPAVYTLKLEVLANGLMNCVQCVHSRAACAPLTRGKPLERPSIYPASGFRSGERLSPSQELTLLIPLSLIGRETAIPHRHLQPVSLVRRHPASRNLNTMIPAGGGMGGIPEQRVLLYLLTTGGVPLLPVCTLVGVISKPLKKLCQILQCSR